MRICYCAWYNVCVNKKEQQKGMWRQCSVLRSSIFNQESSVTPLLTQLHIPAQGGKNCCLKYRGHIVKLSIKYLWTIQTWGLGMLKVSLRLPTMTSTEPHIPYVLFSFVWIKNKWNVWSKFNCLRYHFFPCSEFVCSRKWELLTLNLVQTWFPNLQLWSNGWRRSCRWRPVGQG